MLLYGKVFEQAARWLSVCPSYGRSDKTILYMHNVRFQEDFRAFFLLFWLIMVIINWMSGSRAGWELNMSRLRADFELVFELIMNGEEDIFLYYIAAFAYFKPSLFFLNYANIFLMSKKHIPGISHTRVQNLTWSHIRVMHAKKNPPLPLRGNGGNVRRAFF